MDLDKTITPHVRRSAGRRFAAWWFVLCGVVLVGSLRAVSAVGDVGYRDFSFGTSGLSTPTGEKPESKLWWNDGFWWGSLYNDQAQEYHIYRLDPTTQRWFDTGTVIDDRNSSLADTLWDNTNQKLYVASHIFNRMGVETKSNWARLYRYSYAPATDTYSLDPGFPVAVTRGQSETLVLAKDSVGQLWVTYVENIKDALGNIQRTRVMVNNSEPLRDDVWGTPFELPVESARNVSADDISSVVAFGGRIGVMWSNQGIPKKYFFATHVDGTPRDQWQGSVAAYGAGTAADDHISLNAFEDGETGKVFAVVKTNYTGPRDDYIVLLSCEISTGCVSDGNWQPHVVYRACDVYPPGCDPQPGAAPPAYAPHTRPILVIDSENRKLHVFTSPESGGAIFHKVSDLDNIAFPKGPGEPFIRISTDVRINNATSTKQHVNSTTDLVVLASDQITRFYVHNYLNIEPAPVGPTATSVPTATSEPTATPTTTPPANASSQVFLPLVDKP